MDGAMELLVELEQPAEIVAVRGDHLILDQMLQGREIVIARSLAGAPHHLDLDRLADELGGLDLLEPDRCDPRSALRIDVDQAEIGEAQKSLAHRRPRDRKTFGDLAFPDRIKRPQDAQHDVAAQQCVDILRSRPRLH